jgi:hypothetical protein
MPRPKLWLWSQQKVRFAADQFAIRIGVVTGKRDGFFRLRAGHHIDAVHDGLSLNLE